MSKVKVPCAVCGTEFYRAVSDKTKRKICTACKRKGRHCKECGVEITKDLMTTRPGLCFVCFAAALWAEEERATRKTEKTVREPVTPVVVYGDGDGMDMLRQDTALFGGFSWGSPNVNPVG